MPRYLVNHFEGRFSVHDDPRIEDIIQYLRRTSWINHTKDLNIIQPDFTHVPKFVAVLQVPSAPSRVTLVMPQESAVILIVHTHLVAISVALARVEVVLALDMITTIVTIVEALDAVLCPLAGRDTPHGGRGQVLPNPDHQENVTIASMNVNNDDANNAIHAAHEPERASEFYFSTTVRPRITVLLRGHVVGIESNVTRATAAKSSFISSDLVRQCGITVEAVDLPAYGPDDTTLTVHGMAMVPLTFGSVNISIRVIVANLAPPW
jgi:hypothetical protein